MPKKDPEVDPVALKRWQKQIDKARDRLETAREMLGKRSVKAADAEFVKVRDELTEALKAAPDKLRQGETLLQRARVNFERTDFKAACDDALQVAVNAPVLGDDAALLMARAERQLWNFPAALDACDRFTSPTLRTAAICEANRALVFVLMEDWDKAAAAVDLALVSWDECPTALLANASIAFFHDHDAERADAILTKAIALAPNDPELRVLRAQVRTKLRSFKDAIDDCDEAAKRCFWLDPHVVRIQAKLACDRWAYMIGKKQPLAMEADIDAVVGLGTPNTAAEWVQTATLHRLKNEFEKAIKCCNNAIAIQPTAIPALLARAGVQVDRREYASAAAAAAAAAAAVADCRKVLDQCPENAQALYLLGQVSLRKNELDDALQAYNRSERSEPRFVLPIRGRSDVHKLLKEYAKVIEICDQGLKIEPDHASLYSNRAFAKSQTGDPNGAIRDYDKAIEFDSSNSIFFNNRGLVRASKKGVTPQELEKSVEDFTDAIRRSPRFENAYRNRAAALSGLQRYDESKEDVRTANGIRASAKSREPDPR